MRASFHCHAGETFLVTGASSGIGFAVAQALAQAGGCVVGLSRERAKLEAAMARLPGDGHVALPCDLGQAAGLQEALRELAGRGEPLAGLVHAAGIHAFTPLRAFRREKAEEIARISLWMGIELVKLVTGDKKLRGPQGMSCVLLGSSAGHVGRPGLAAYSAVKAGVAAAARCLSHELAPLGVRVNTVSPGIVDTPMTARTLKTLGGGLQKEIQAVPLGLGRPEDVTGAVLYLLSQEASWITGAEFVVDGGYLA